MTWEISWAEMCRVCMEVEGVLVPLFDENHRDDLNFSDKLSNIAPIEIDKSDGLPSKVCTNCAQSINSLYNFKNLVIESDQKLRQMFDMQTMLEKENDCHDVYDILIKKEGGTEIPGDIGNSICDVQKCNNILQPPHQEMYHTVVPDSSQIDDSQLLIGGENITDSLIQNDKLDAGLPSENQDLVNEYHFVQKSTFDVPCIENSDRRSKVKIDITMSPSAPAHKPSFSTKRTDTCTEEPESEDSDSDSYVESQENIVGSLNDTITKVKEIKEDGKVVQYQCTLCSQNYHKLSEALNHIVELHVPTTGPFYCVICEMDCDSIRQLKAHVKTHTGPTPYTCFLCKKSYILKRYLKRHMACHTDFPRHRCAKCGERFIVKSELEVHILSHANEGTGFRCSQCPRKFAHKGNYKRHLITHLDPLGLHLPKFPCTVCHKRFMNNRTLETHMRVHTGEKPFHCEICGKSFSQQGNLINHRKIHSNPRSFTCELCGKSFNQKATLRDHAKLHSGEKPYVCNVCGVAFTFSAALRRHMWSHSDDKPYGCDMCDAKFTGRYDLNRHMKIHLGYPKRKSKSKTIDAVSSIEVPEEIVNVFEDPSQTNTIFVEQIFLCDDAVGIISQEDSEKENVDSLLKLV